MHTLGIYFKPDAPKGSTNIPKCFSNSLTRKYLKKHVFVFLLQNQYSCDDEEKSLQIHGSLVSLITTGPGVVGASVAMGTFIVELIVVFGCFSIHRASD